MAQFILSAFADEVSPHLEEQIAALKRNGIPCIEPRNIDGGLLSKSDDELKEIRKQLDKAGITLSAFGSPIGKYKIEEPLEGHLPDFRRALEVCKILGTPRMRMFSFFLPKGEDPKSYRAEVLRRLSRMLDEAEKAGVLLCHENESEIYGKNPEEVADLYASLPGLRGIFDGANYVREGQDPIKGFEATAGSLEYLHVKDAKADGDRPLVPVGMGGAQYEEVLRRVGKSDKTYYLTLEPHLFIFDAYKKIDNHKLETELEFESADAAFDAAANALKTLLTKLGYHEENRVWKK
ncbi:MAG: sugar phosphate isomerase/epimerase [Clostridia bacterium]|nr:sugar phosphate isomerase/epimerase [Clostridia bacterium]